MTTKFDIGQEVFVVDGTDLINGRIDSIFITSSHIVYSIDAVEDEFEEHQLFTDKLDAMIYWMRLNAFTN